MHDITLVGHSRNFVESILKKSSGHILMAGGVCSTKYFFNFHANATAVSYTSVKTRLLAGAGVSTQTRVWIYIAGSNGHIGKCI